MDTHVGLGSVGICKEECYYPTPWFVGAIPTGCTKHLSLRTFKGTTVPSRLYSGGFCKGLNAWLFSQITEAQYQVYNLPQHALLSLLKKGLVHSVLSGSMVSDWATVNPFN